MGNKCRAFVLRGSFDHGWCKKDAVETINGKSFCKLHAYHEKKRILRNEKIATEFEENKAKSERIIEKCKYLGEQLGVKLLPAYEGLNKPSLSENFCKISYQDVLNIIDRILFAGKAAKEDR